MKKFIKDSFIKYLLKSPQCVNKLALLSCLLFSTTPAKATPNDEFFGTQVSVTGFANLNIGGQWRSEPSYRFVSKYDGALVSFQVLWIAKTEKTYSKGSGGKITITLRKGDASPVPGEIIASTSHTPALNPATFEGGQNSSASKFATIYFRQPIPIKKNQIYHLTFRNDDNDPVNNYISLNCLMNWSGKISNRSPTLSEAELSASYHAQGNPWEVRTGYLPVMALHVDRNNDGKADVSQGVGFVGADKDGHKENPLTLGGQTRYRQLIRPSSTVTVSKLYLSAGKGVGSRGITAQLRDRTGTVRASALLGASQYRAKSTSQCNADERATRCRNWGEASLSSPVQLEQGQIYFLELSAPSGESYYLTGLKDGAHLYGLPADTTFPFGYAEISSNGGTTFTPWQDKKLDLEFFFETSTQSPPPPSATPLPSVTPPPSTTPRSKPSIQGFYLLNADTGKVVAPLRDQATYDLSDLRIRRVTVGAKVNGAIRYAQFRLNGNYVFNLDEKAPYTLTEEIGVNRYTPLFTTSGKRNVITLYLKGSNDNSSGEEVYDRQTIYFTIKN